MACWTVVTATDPGESKAGSTFLGCNWSEIASPAGWRWIRCARALLEQIQKMTATASARQESNGRLALDSSRGLLSCTITAWTIGVPPRPADESRMRRSAAIHRLQTLALGLWSRPDWTLVARIRVIPWTLVARLIISTTRFANSLRD